MFLRIGLHGGHGEVRNGGFPDWLLEKQDFPLRLRLNSALSCAGRGPVLGGRCDQLVKGQMYEDGGTGPSGIQIEINGIMGHVGGQTRRKPGVPCIWRNLNRKMAKRRLAFGVPLYTQPAAGGAVSMAAYAYGDGRVLCGPPWGQQVDGTGKPMRKLWYSPETENDSPWWQNESFHVSEQLDPFDRGKFFPYFFTAGTWAADLQPTEHQGPVPVRNRYRSYVK